LILPSTAFCRATISLLSPGYRHFATVSPLVGLSLPRIRCHTAASFRLLNMSPNIDSFSGTVRATSGRLPLRERHYRYVLADAAARQNEQNCRNHHAPVGNAHGRPSNTTSTQWLGYRRKARRRFLGVPGEVNIARIIIVSSPLATAQQPTPGRRHHIGHSLKPGMHYYHQHASFRDECRSLNTRLRPPNSVLASIHSSPSRSLIQRPISA